MRSKFDLQLSELNREMTKMGNMIEDSIAGAIDALVNSDVKKAEKIMKSDEEIDRIEKNIERICFNLIMQQQPVAGDLRNITAAMKMVTDMERIGDHAADISEITVYLSNIQNKLGLDHINNMASETMLMLNWSIEAYVERDRNKAYMVIEHDDVVDGLFDTIKSEIIGLIHDNPEAGEAATDLLMVAKYFERIGDHATNIAEWVIYSLGKSEG